MKLSDAFPSPFLSSSDLNDELPATVSHLKKEEVGSQRDPKWILYFNGVKKGMVLNVTNWKTLEKHYGDTVNWPGQPVVIYVIDTEFRGEPVQGIRVKVPRSKSAQAPDPVLRRPAIRPGETGDKPDGQIEAGSRIGSLLTEAEAIARQGVLKYRDWRDHLGTEEYALLRAHLSDLLLIAQEATDRDKT